MKIIQISDVHLSKNPSDRIFGLVNTNETFIDVIAKVQDECPDFVIATGDLSQDGSVESYQRLKDQLLTLNCDVFVIYGNHDNPEIMDKTLIGKNIKHIPFHQTPYGTFIFCNSFKENYDTGFISKIELNSLEKHLNTFTNCIPVIHHHFVKLNAFIDKFILENSNDLLDLLTEYESKIKFCITGHVHNSYDIIFNNIHIHNSLSTCIQFAKTEQLLFDFKKPGYTVYNFIEDKYEISEKTI